MARFRRVGVAAALISSLLLVGSAGIAAATTPTYTVTFCYDAANTQIDIHQIWSGLEVDEVAGIIGDGKVGFGYDYHLAAPATSGDEFNTLLADPGARLVSTSVLDQGSTVGAKSLRKHGSWAKSMPAC